VGLEFRWKLGQVLARGIGFDCQGCPAGGQTMHHHACSPGRGLGFDFDHQTENRLLAAVVD
jgi:hypothetical protein